MATAQTPFYEGKNVLLLSGTDAGGAGDLRTRAVIPVLKKHIPGHPNIVVQYMPGAGGRKAANHMYKSVRPDGLTIGAMITGMVQGTIFGETDVLYELDKFIYLGSHARYAPYAFLTRKAAGFNTRETLTAARGVRIGAPSVGHSLYTMARLFAYMLDMKEPRLVTGYTPREIDFALERNEIDARVSILDSLLTRNATGWIKISCMCTRPSIFPRASNTPIAGSPSFPRSRVSLAQIKTAASSSFFAARATPASRLSCRRVRRRSKSKYCVKPCANRLPIRSTSKLTKAHLGAAMPIAWEEFETQLRELPREAEIIDLFKKLSGPAPLPARPSR